MKIEIDIINNRLGIIGSLEGHIMHSGFDVKEDTTINNLVNMIEVGVNEVIHNLLHAKYVEPYYEKT